MKHVLLVAAFMTGIYGAACSGDQTSWLDKETSMRIYDLEDHNRVVAILEKNDVPHRVSDDREIFYPISAWNQVDAARQEVWGPVEYPKAGVSVRSDDAAEVAAALIAQEIPFSLSYRDDGAAIFTWNKIVNESGMDVVQDVLKAKGH
jgi:hypothetical protein